jgi:hypothetical protein
MPTENGSARARNEIITYVPHFWLGIAKFNLGEVDAALREWKISEEHGAVQGTQYYSQLRDWVARAQSQKQRNAESAAGDSKREANAAVGRAVSAQMDALAAGADRSDRYRAAQRKLREAMDAAGSAGTDIRAYRRAAEAAQQSHDLFVASTQEAKQQKASRPPVVARPKPQPQPQPQPVQVVPQPPPPIPVTQTHPTPVKAPAPSPRIEPLLEPPPVSVAVEEKKQLSKPKQVEVVAHVENIRSQLQVAYRAFAGGDLASSEHLLTRILSRRESSEAYLLRGCARYTRAMLSRDPDSLLDDATADFRAALKLNRSLRLDRNDFSPKLVTFFEQVRKSS